MTDRPEPQQDDYDLVIVGAGAAGLMAAIWAGRTHPERSILIVDSAKKLGAKILVAGGGRCNVTHHEVNEHAYAGSSRHAIKKVLRRFDVPQTIAFFQELGVELKREPTGKLFPVTDDAHTVLNALLSAAQQTNVRFWHPFRVEQIAYDTHKFQISATEGMVAAPRVILATGGKSLPKSGSDGHGYTLAAALGHRLTPRIFPALVPLTLPKGHFICGLSGLTLPTTLELRSSAGKRLVSFTNSTLCTHFGLSGPSVLDISRYYLEACVDDPDAALFINWLPAYTAEQVEQHVQSAGHISLLKVLTALLPERLVRALCDDARLDPATYADHLPRDQRRALVQAVTGLRLPISGDRGFTYAEVTAGGIPLSEIRLETMESRLCRGLYFCGEICDVDGRIGGFNFQWAWASGYVAGVSA